MSTTEEGRISTASCILANNAMKLGRTLQWDAERQQVANDEEANRLSPDHTVSLGDIPRREAYESGAQEMRLAST